MVGLARCCWGAGWLDTPVGAGAGWRNPLHAPCGLRVSVLLSRLTSPCTSLAPPHRQMYTRAGYRKVMEQPEWQRILEQRAHPLQLYMRTLPWEARQAARQAAAEEAAAAEAAEAERQPQKVQPRGSRLW